MPGGSAGDEVGFLGGFQAEIEVGDAVGIGGSIDGDFDEVIFGGEGIGAEAELSAEAAGGEAGAGARIGEAGLGGIISQGGGAVDVEDQSVEVPEASAEDDAPGNAAGEIDAGGRLQDEGRGVGGDFLCGVAGGVDDGLGGLTLGIWFVVDGVDVFGSGER